MRLEERVVRVVERRLVALISSEMLMDSRQEQKALAVLRRRSCPAMPLRRQRRFLSTRSMDVFEAAEISFPLCFAFVRVALARRERLLVVMAPSPSVLRWMRTPPLGSKTTVFQ